MISELLGGVLTDYLSAPYPEPADRALRCLIAVSWTFVVAALVPRDTRPRSGYIGLAGFTLVAFFFLGLAIFAAMDCGDGHRPELRPASLRAL